MKINTLNKIYVGLGIILVLGSIYRIVSFKSWERYYYFSSVMAPANFPVYIRECYFITPDQDDMAWINKEDVNNFQSKWGNEYYFAESNNSNRLPQKLVIEYASYRNSKFYGDTLELPQQKIREIFKSAERNNKTEEIYSPGQNRKGLRFVIGIANDGNILVWIRGVFLEELILKTKLKAHEPKGDETHYEKQLPKKTYLKKVFENLPDSLKDEFANGLDAGANYIDTPTHYFDLNKENWKQEKSDKGN